MRIIVFGDSISQGAFDVSGGGWVSVLASKEYKKKLDGDWSSGVSIVNSSIPGEKSTGLRQRIYEETKSRLWPNDQHVVLIAVGMNDVSRFKGDFEVSIEKFRENILESISCISDMVDRVVLVGFTFVDNSRTQPVVWADKVSWKQSEVEKYNEVFKQISLENEVTFIHMMDLFREDPEKYLSEGIHPNTEGHRLMFNRVSEVLKSENIL